MSNLVTEKAKSNAGKRNGEELHSDLPNKKSRKDMMLTLHLSYGAKAVNTVDEHGKSSTTYYMNPSTGKFSETIHCKPVTVPVSGRSITGVDVARTITNVLKDPSQMKYPTNFDRGYHLVMQAKPDQTRFSSGKNPHPYHELQCFDLDNFKIYDNCELRVVVVSKVLQHIC